MPRCLVWVVQNVLAQITLPGQNALQQQPNIFRIRDMRFNKLEDNQIIAFWHITEGIQVPKGRGIWPRECSFLLLFFVVDGKAWFITAKSWVSLLSNLEFWKIIWIFISVKSNPKQSAVNLISVLILVKELNCFSAFRWTADTVSEKKSILFYPGNVVFAWKWLSREQPGGKRPRGTDR